MAVGEKTKAHIMSEDGLVFMLAQTACAKVNCFFETRGYDYVFTVHPSTRPSDSQVKELI